VFISGNHFHVSLKFGGKAGAIQIAELLMAFGVIVGYQSSPHILDTLVYLAYVSMVAKVALLQDKFKRLVISLSSLCMCETIRIN